MPDDETWDDADGPEPTGAVEATCPYCGEPVDLVVDPFGGAVQEYVEDCPVCCRPWQVYVEVDENGRAQAWLDAADE